MFKESNAQNHKVKLKAKIIKRCLVLLIGGLLVVSVDAFEFEKYRWGRSMSETKEVIKANGKRLLPSSGERFLSYTDTILDEECRVILEFTPRTKLLASIKITWVDKNVGEDVKQLLVSKYGEYVQPNVFVEEYFWYGGTQYDSIALNYDYAGTRLVYFGGRFQQQYESEFKELIDREKSRF